MISKLHERLGTAGFVLSIVALVAAVSGTAIAATKLNATQKKEVEKIATKYAGKPGATGPAGATGLAGPLGSKGDAGGAGANGANGAPGASGKSVALGTPTGSECAPGGITVEVEGTPSSKKKVCNGKEGSPWTAGGLLPEKATETGTWGTGSSTPAGNKTFPISFTLPLQTAPQPILVGPTEVSKLPGCPGRGGTPTVPGIPQAEPGKLCVYIMGSESVVFQANPFKTWEFEPAVFEEWELVPGASPAGTLVEATCTAVCQISGTWAVTGPEE
jgi:hypothetical protein